MTDYFNTKRDEIFSILSSNSGEHVLPSEIMKIYDLIAKKIEEIYEKGKTDLANELLSNDNKLSEFLNQKISKDEKKNKNK